MKLSKKLQKSYTILIVLVILVSALLSSFLFQRSLNSFLEKSRNKEFERISQEISELTDIYTAPNLIYLENYVRNKNINLTFYNTKNQVIAQFIGISETYENTVQLVTNKYHLVNDGEITGYLAITYAEDVFIYDKSTSEFYAEMVKNSALLFLGAILIASIITVFISKIITNPIVDIQKMAKNIRQKNYDLEQKEYNIYELDELSSDINYLAQTLKIQDKIRTDYASDIAHELRTPITNLMLHLEGIRDDVVEADEYTINVLLSEIYRMNALIDNLQVSFANSEKFTELTLEDVNLSQLIEQVTDSFKLSFAEKDISLELDLNEDTVINTDKSKLTQIFSNIISNSIKAVDNNGNIKIIQKSLKNREVIRISDDGIGIDEEDLKHIFERFYRVDNVRNTKISGHGLGLSITKSFVDLLGYNLTVDSIVGKGTEFILTINKTN